MDLLWGGDDAGGRDEMVEKKETSMQGQDTLDYRTLGSFSY